MSNPDHNFERTVSSTDDNARQEEAGRVLGKLGAIDPKSVKCLMAIIVSQPDENNKNEVTFSLLGTADDTVAMTEAMLNFLSERPGSRIMVQHGDDLDASVQIDSLKESTWGKN